MTMRQLTQDEINQVAAHLESTRLPPDLQTDLLDHLCCAIEAYLSQGIAFDEALQTTLEAWSSTRIRTIKKDLQFTVKTKPMLIRLTAMVAVLAGLFFLFPFPSSAPQAPAPLAETLQDTLPPVLVVQHTGPPTASPVAGLDMHTKLTSGFGMRVHPILKKRQHHRGIDLKAKSGTVVLATADGIVIFADSDGLYGITVRIRHANGYTTVYAHLSEHSVRVGQEVKLGQIIAAVGTTGASTAPHLHYEVRKDNQPVDPLALLD